MQERLFSQRELAEIGDVSQSEISFADALGSISPVIERGNLKLYRAEHVAEVFQNAKSERLKDAGNRILAASKQ